MTNTREAVSPALNARDRIIVALDVETADEAWGIVQELRGRVGAFKVGLQLFTAAGPSLVREFTAAGANIFLDLKFHDIPNTVARASVEAARLGVWMFNVHTVGGKEMMRLAAEAVEDACSREGIRRPLITGVTVLTSSTQQTLTEMGVDRPIEEQVVSLARSAAECGLDGVVASAREVTAVRRAIPASNFLTITPGIRPNDATADDQKRVTTFQEAIANGSDYVVIGRPVLNADDRAAAVEKIVETAK